ncbi:MAG TPA: bacillithiol biosynthesis BshC, partial [Gemmatimonadaceae bacterium]|nr:bacillithiol biosynthesis BshC [Gemmatimonadaceae bacterium]
DREPIELLKRFYTPEATIGSAYVAFIRALFAPLGIAVIDASHPATRAAAKLVLRGALEKADEIAAAVSARNRELESTGFMPQVQDVPGLSLVFSGASGGRKRVPIKAAVKHARSDDLGPNVLLRPVVERAILPTATYIGGPAEIGYFAQIAPIAETLGVARPAIVPRWSCVIIEPHVERILEKLHLLPEDLRDPHEAEARVARSRLPKVVIDELNATRAVLDERLAALGDAIVKEGAPVAPAVTGGLRAILTRRLDRFERRLIAAAKKQHADIMQEIGTARGSLYPLGKPQERSLNFVPLLARYGPMLRDEMLAGARIHAERILGDAKSPRSLVEAGTARGRS